MNSFFPFSRSSRRLVGFYVLVGLASVGLARLLEAARPTMSLWVWGLVCTTSYLTYWASSSLKRKLKHPELSGGFLFLSLGMARSFLLLGSILIVYGWRNDWLRPYSFLMVGLLLPTILVEAVLFLHQSKRESQRTNKDTQ